MASRARDLGGITQIGQIGGQAVWGSARTGYGITLINGVTSRWRYEW